IARRLARERGIDLTTVSGTGPGGRIIEEDILSYQPAPDAPAAGGPEPGEVRASPIARRLARERGIDLAMVNGTGPGGRIIEADILSYQPAPDVPAAAGERVDLSRMRQTIARVTADSKREAPHFYLTSDVDMTKAMSLRQDINDAVASESRISVNDLIIKAAAMALQRYPKFNASFQGDHLQMNPGVNIGIAIALDAGLIVPGIAGCESKSLVEIATASRDLIDRAHTGTLRDGEYSGTTFSISNLGMFDVDSFAAIIYPPHAAVLAVGAVKEQPVGRDGQVVLAQMMKATLSVDHRVADGAEAAQFLMEVKKLLESPARMLL
ncbi:MAG: 2-oxo acid dehydrogenase subunit E2, partial [Chloroflexi bacterium]|nr:2-oxo acid dehydrogenase subunit E2 [Chloroflexota bacterium]